MVQLLVSGVICGGFSGAGNEVDVTKSEWGGLCVGAFIELFSVEEEE